jgi:hypothetical protein
MANNRIARRNQRNDGKRIERQATKGAGTGRNTSVDETEGGNEEKGIKEN